MDYIKALTTPKIASDSPYSLISALKEPFKGKLGVSEGS